MIFNDLKSFFESFLVLLRHFKGVSKLFQASEELKTLLWSYEDSFSELQVLQAGPLKKAFGMEDPLHVPPRCPEGKGLRRSKREENLKRILREQRTYLTCELR